MIDVDTSFILMTLGTIAYGTFVFRKLSGLATISLAELAILHIIFYLPLQLLGRMLNTNGWTLFALYLLVGLALVPVFLPKLRYGVLNRQGFLRLVGLDRNKGIVVDNEEALKNIDVLVVDPSLIDDAETEGKPGIDPLFEKALKAGISVETVPDFLERSYGYMEIRHHVSASQIHIKNARVFDAFKTAVDVVAALVLIVILLPVLMIICCLVVIIDGSPGLFRQERLGQGGKSFKILKFRTMTAEGKTMRTGKFLRHSHFDELPQLFNVLAGDMALVGPRPEWVFLTTSERAPADYWTRRKVKPGISGWAQVNYRPSRSRHMREKKLGYDIYYINNRSVFLDSLIWLRTAYNLLRPLVFWLKRK